MRLGNIIYQILNKNLHNSQRVATQALCSWSLEGPCEHIAIEDKEWVKALGNCWGQIVHDLRMILNACKRSLSLSSSNSKLL